MSMLGHCGHEDADDGFCYQCVIDGLNKELEAKDKLNQNLKLGLSEACDDIDTLYSMTEWIEDDYLEGRSKIYRELLTKEDRSNA